MRARAALDGGNVATVSPGKPHARELHNVFPRWQCFHFGANPTRELHPRKNFSGGETGATPRARELHRELWKRCPHSRANPTSARATPQVRGCRFFRHDNEPDKKDRHGEDVA